MVNRRTATRKVCADVISRVSWLLSTDELQGKDETIGALRQFAKDLEDASEGAVALFDLVYDEQRG